MEGKLKGCKKSKCKNTCCDDGVVQEWVDEYFAFHENIKDYIASLGIKTNFVRDRVYFENCSDGEKCKFLKYSTNKNIDPRPIDCKIYPFAVDWDDIDFDKKIVYLSYWDNECPLVVNKSIPNDFRHEVVNIIKHDFATLFYGARFEVKFLEKIHED